MYIIQKKLIGSVAIGAVGATVFLFEKREVASMHLVVADGEASLVQSTSSSAHETKKTRTEEEHFLENEQFDELYKSLAQRDKDRPRKLRLRKAEKEIMQNKKNWVGASVAAEQPERAPLWSAIKDNCDYKNHDGEASSAIWKCHDYKTNIGYKTLIKILYPKSTSDDGKKFKFVFDSTFPELFTRTSCPASGFIEGTFSAHSLQVFQAFGSPNDASSRTQYQIARVKRLLKAESLELQRGQVINIIASHVVTKVMESKFAVLKVMEPQSENELALWRQTQLELFPGSLAPWHQLKLFQENLRPQAIDSRMMLATPNGYSIQNFVLALNAWLEDSTSDLRFELNFDSCVAHDTSLLDFHIRDPDLIACFDWSSSFRPMAKTGEFSNAKQMSQDSSGNNTALSPLPPFRTASKFRMMLPKSTKDFKRGILPPWAGPAMLLAGDLVLFLFFFFAPKQCLDWSGFDTDSFTSGTMKYVHGTKIVYILNLVQFMGLICHGRALFHLSALNSSAKTKAILNLASVFGLFFSLFTFRFIFHNNPAVFTLAGAERKIFRFFMLPRALVCFLSVDWSLIQSAIKKSKKNYNFITMAKDFPILPASVIMAAIQISWSVSHSNFNNISASSAGFVHEILEKDTKLFDIAMLFIHGFAVSQFNMVLIAFSFWFANDQNDCYAFSKNSAIYFFTLGLHFALTIPTHQVLGDLRANYVRVRYVSVAAYMALTLLAVWTAKKNKNRDAKRGKRP
eukprot:gene313-1139_t